MTKSKIIKDVKGIIKTDFSNVDTFLVDSHKYYDRMINGKEYLNLFKVAKKPNSMAKTAKTAKTI